MGKAFSGWLISNGGLRMPKFTEQLDWFVSAFDACGMNLHAIDNHRLTAAVIDGRPMILRDGKFQDDPDFVLFWDKDIRLARMMERAGFRLFNSAAAIAACDDKCETHRILSGHGIPMPDTLMAPFFYPGLGVEAETYLVRAEQCLGYPMVVKEAFGSFGAQVYLVENREALAALLSRLREVPHLCQRYVRSSHGRDVRLQVVGDRVVAAMMRTSDSDFRANVSAGASMTAFFPPTAFSALAVQVAGLLGADFAGVDLLFGDNGEPIVCEVNSNAHMRNMHTCTGVDIPLEIAAYVRRKLEAT